jgi:hypothetical protein
MANQDQNLAQDFKSIQDIPSHQRQVFGSQQSSHLYINNPAQSPPSTTRNGLAMFNQTGSFAQNEKESLIAHCKLLF